MWNEHHTISFKTLAIGPVCEVHKEKFTSYYHDSSILNYYNRQSKTLQPMNGEGINPVALAIIKFWLTEGV